MSKVNETMQSISSANVVLVGPSAQQLKLTSAEQEVLRFLAQGLKYPEIAQKRLTSVSTVRKQCYLLLSKLGLGNREKLIAWAAVNCCSSSSPSLAAILKTKR